MTCFFETTCHKCGFIDEAKFVYAGPHIKQVCNNCGFYVKFFNTALIPDVQEIKLKIWNITDQNLELINKAKSEVEFVAGLTGINAKMMYWRLYLRLRTYILNPNEVNHNRQP